MKRKFNIAYLIIFVSCFFVLNLFLIHKSLTISFFEGIKYINTLEFIKNPVIAEFLGLTPNTDFSETKLEKSIITNLQKFLMELQQKLF